MENDIRKLELYIRFVLRKTPEHTSADNRNYEIANILEKLIARNKELEAIVAGKTIQELGMSDLYKDK